MYIFVQMTLMVLMANVEVEVVAEPQYHTLSTLEECKAAQVLWRTNVLQLESGDIVYGDGWCYEYKPDAEPYIFNPNQFK